MSENTSYSIQVVLFHLGDCEFYCIFINKIKLKFSLPLVTESLYIIFLISKISFNIATVGQYLNNIEIKMHHVALIL